MSKRLSVYLMSFPETPELAEAAVEGGADLLELGFPFSDPLADGPVIRLAGERALERGHAHAARVSSASPETRQRLGDDVPLIPMTYASILEAYGYDRFWADARMAGATSLIVADLPIEAAPELPRVQLVAPTSTTERIELAAARTDGWLYLVSLTGTTGARGGVSSQLEGLVERARAVTDVPLLAGFGIATPEQAAAAASLADGVVVGSRAVQVADEAGPDGLRDYVASLRAALDADQRPCASAAGQGHPIPPPAFERYAGKARPCVTHCAERVTRSARWQSNGARRNGPRSPCTPPLAEGADALAAHGGVAGPDHCTVAIVRVLAAVEGVDHPVVGCCKEAVVPFLAEQPVGAAAAPQPVEASPPSRRSSSEPPQSRSAPSSPLSESLPFWPKRKSAAPSPETVSSPASARMKSRLPEPVRASSPRRTALEDDAWMTSREHPYALAVDGDVAHADDRTVAAIAAVDDVRQAVSSPE